MWKYAICNETFGTIAWEETCGHIANSDYDGVEIAPFILAPDVRTISAKTRRIYAQTAQDAGLEIVGLHWLLVSPEGLSLTDPDDNIRSHTASYLAALADFCADLGGSILVLGSPRQRRIPPDETAQIAADRLLTGLEPALARAALHNLTLCLEPLPPPEADFILTLQQAIDVVNRAAHPHLRTILDVKSASSEAAPVADLIEQHAPFIAHVHANDVNRRGPGFGSTDFVPILNALKKVNYNGYVSVEVFDYMPDPLTIARDSLAHLRRCQPKPE